mgnify:FL=1
MTTIDTFSTQSGLQVPERLNLSAYEEVELDDWIDDPIKSIERRKGDGAQPFLAGLYLAVCDFIGHADLARTIRIWADEEYADKPEWLQCMYMQTAEDLYNLVESNPSFSIS